MNNSKLDPNYVYIRSHCGKVYQVIHMLYNKEAKCYLASINEDLRHKQITLVNVEKQNYRFIHTPQLIQVLKK